MIDNNKNRQNNLVAKKQETRKTNRKIAINGTQKRKKNRKDECKKREK